MTPIIGNICFPLPTIAQIVGKGAEGSVSFSLIDYSNPSPPAAAFLAPIPQSTSTAPSPFAAAAYDGVQLWARAVARAGGKTDPDSVAAAMIGLDYEGLIGHFKITKDNHTGLDTSAYKAISPEERQLDHNVLDTGEEEHHMTDTDGIWRRKRRH